MTTRGYYRTRLDRALSQLRYLPIALRLAREAAPGWTILWALLLVVNGILPALLVYNIKTIHLECS